MMKDIIFLKGILLVLQDLEINNFQPLLIRENLILIELLIIKILYLNYLQDGWVIGIQSLKHIIMKDLHHLLIAMNKQKIIDVLINIGYQLILMNIGNSLIDTLDVK